MQARLALKIHSCHDKQDRKRCSPTIKLTLHNSKSATHILLVLVVWSQEEAEVAAALLNDGGTHVGGHDE